jgi:septal ring factor EnvC (AmiA/AmiB activator)
MHVPCRSQAPPDHVDIDVDVEILRCVFDECKKVLNTGSTDEVYEVAAKLLDAADMKEIWQISTEQNLWSGVVQALLQRLCCKTGEAELQQQLLKVLRVVAGDPGNSKAIHAAGGVQQLLSFTAAGNAHPVLTQQAAYTTLQQLLAALAAEPSLLARSLQGLQDERDLLQRQYEDTTAENVRLRQQYEEAAAENARLLQQLQQAAGQQASENRTRLEQQLQQAMEENCSLQAQLKQQQEHTEERCAMLQKQLERTAAESAAAAASHLQQLQQLQQQRAAGQQGQDAAAAAEAAAALEELWRKTEAECSSLLQQLHLSEAQIEQTTEQAAARDAELASLNAELQETQDQLQAATARCQKLQLQLEQRQVQQNHQQAWERVGDARLLQLLLDDKTAAAAASELARRVSACAIDLVTVRRGATKALLQLLASESASVQQHAVFVLHHSIDDQDTAAAHDLIKAGGLQKLVQLMHKSSSAAVQEHAAAAVARLAACSTLARTPNIVPSLVQLLAGSHEGVQRSATAALTNLALQPECISAFSAAGGFGHLVKLLDSKSQKVQNAALVALRNIAYPDAGSKAAVRNAGGLPLVVQLLSSSDVGVQINAAQALCALVVGSRPAAASPANKELFVDLRAPVALQQMKGSTDAYAQHAAAAALKELGLFTAGGASPGGHIDASRPDDQGVGARLPRV